MPRKPCCRRIRGQPGASTFHPSGAGPDGVEEVRMTLDEFEAIRLAHLEGLYQAEAARRMEVSRATFGRILEAANRKVAETLVHGRVLSIEGGPVSVIRPQTVHCPRCDLPRHAAETGETPSRCPRCRHGEG